MKALRLPLSTFQQLQTGLLIQFSSLYLVTFDYLRRGPQARLVGRVSDLIGIESLCTPQEIAWIPVAHWGDDGEYHIFRIESSLLDDISFQDITANISSDLP